MHALYQVPNFFFSYHSTGLSSYHVEQAPTVFQHNWQASLPVQLQCSPLCIPSIILNASPWLEEIHFVCIPQYPVTCVHCNKGISCSQ